MRQLRLLLAMMSFVVGGIVVTVARPTPARAQGGCGNIWCNIVGGVVGCYYQSGFNCYMSDPNTCTSCRCPGCGPT